MGRNCAVMLLQQCCTRTSDSRPTQLAAEIGKHGFGCAAAADHRAIDGGVIAMIAANVYAGASAHGTLRRFKGAGKLLWLGVSNFVTAQESPTAGNFSEPIFHLRNDEAAKLHFGEGLRAKYRSEEH